MPATTTKKVAGGFAAAATAVLLFLFAETIFGGPIVALSYAIGSFRAFVVAALIYGGVSYWGAVKAVSVYDKYKHGQPSHFANWLESQKDAQLKDGKKSRTWHMAEAGGWLGFAVACFLLGAIVTVFLVNYSGRVENVKKLSAIASVIFAVSYAGVYSGAFSLIAGR